MPHTHKQRYIYILRNGISKYKQRIADKFAVLHRQKSKFHVSYTQARIGRNENSYPSDE